MLNIGSFSTGRNEAARQLFQTVQDCIKTGNIDRKISFVFSSHEPGQTKESDLFFEPNRNVPLQLIRHHEPARKFPPITFDAAIAESGRDQPQGR